MTLFVRCGWAWLLLLGACRPSSQPDAPVPPLIFSAEPAWPDRAPATHPPQGRLVVTNDLEDTLSFFDVSKVGQGVLPELERVPVGKNPVEIEAPHHAAMTAQGDFLFVNLGNFAPGTGSGPHGAQHGGNKVSGTLLKIRTRDNVTVGSARVDRNPGDLAISPDSKQIAVSHFDLLRITEATQGEAPDPDARVLLVDAETMEVTARIRVCPAPHGLVYSKDGKRLYVACFSDEIAVVNLLAPEFPVTRIKVASNAGDAYRAVHQPYAVAESPLTRDVFISCLGSGEVRVLKAQSLTIDEARTRLVGGSPYIGAFSADGNTLWVPHQGDDRISEIDPATGVQRRVLTPNKGSCINVHQVMPAPDPRYLVAVCEGYHVGAGTLVVLDVQTGATLSVTNVGVFPDFVGLLRTP
jgi:DNA-binding beta-propeller fold protein YncE